MVGIAMRSAFSLGLHVQHDDQSVSTAQRQSMICTWWSLHSLESLLSSITGRPSIIPNEDITTPLPGAFASDQTQRAGVVNFDFLNADTNLNLLTQQIISHLYTQRKSTPSWDYLQQTTAALVGDLDKWAVDHISEFRSQESNSAHMQQRDVFLLKLQYYRLKILCTRPSLRRIERCFEAGTDDFNSLDESVAEACVRAAHDVASLLASEPQLKSLYEKGPWWTIVHNSTSIPPRSHLLLHLLTRLFFSHSHASTRRTHDRHILPGPLPRFPPRLHPQRPPTRLFTPWHVRHQCASLARLPIHLLDRQDE
jgi:hypothetical protein